jgi:polyisoprenoid-binding protein YceI
MTQVQTPNALAGLTAGTWNIDPTHSTVEFVVRHLMVSKVRGRFQDVSGAITVGSDPLASKVEAIIAVKSVDTGNADRDNHLRTNDFFSPDTFPTITFKSTSIKGSGVDYTLVGELTLKGVTKRVELALEFNGVSADPWGGTRAGFSANGEINRKDFGVEWNAPLEGGGVVIGEKVKLELEIEAIKAS